MKYFDLDKEWQFRRGLLDSIEVLEREAAVIVNLPHDSLIGTSVTKDAPARSDSGYFAGDVCNYTKYLMIEDDWKNDCIYLYFDGAMMHASVDINGCKVMQHHYGYSPFYVDITDYVTYGEENRITVNINTGVQPSSRWYTGAGLFRGVKLCRSPRVHIVPDGIFMSTKEVSDNTAMIEAQVEVANQTLENRLVEVKIQLMKDGTENVEKTVKRVIQVDACNKQTAHMAFLLNDSQLWDCDNPNLYKVKVFATDTGVFRTHFIANESESVDVDETLFGIRSISVDALRGLRINGKSTKLKGGCVHHDNGLLGAVSLYESEERRIKKLKEIGFNAIRTAHNPPSKVLVEACDRVGMYIFDEAFDAWGVAKRTGDYSQHFESQWQSDLQAFVKRDRVHPSVIMWSIGNEIPERGGLNNGYTLATSIANEIKKLDTSRPVSNGICSYWGGLDDHLMKGQSTKQNANEGELENLWEKGTEPFTNGLDVVGYNYMEDLYEKDHEMFPDRVILGSENFANQIGYHWPLVESLPYVIGEFTWTAWDYIGEAGIGKAVYVTEDDPLVQKGSWELMPPSGSPFPWRTANDADVDINGKILPQGCYRSVIWGSDKTHLFSLHPDFFGKIEMMTMWGFPAFDKNWNYKNYENKPIELVVFSNGDEVELVVNGTVIERKKVSMEKPMPKSVRFETEFKAGVVEAISYRDGKEISRDMMQTSKEPAMLRLTASKDTMRSDGHDVIYADVEVVDEDGLLVCDASIDLDATLEGCGVIAGFGSANPITDEKYTDPKTTTFRGRATIVIRSEYDNGSGKITISSEDVGKVEFGYEIK